MHLRFYTVLTAQVKALLATSIKFIDVVEVKELTTSEINNSLEDYQDLEQLLLSDFPIV